MFRMTWSEASGAFGDLGTFLPLTVALVQSVGLDLGTTLIATGLFNMASGWLFDIPLPVQPMKAIAAVALATTHKALGNAEVMAAGMFVGLCVLVLGGLNLVPYLTYVPRPVICGLQLSLGLQLAQQGVHMLWGKGWATSPLLEGPVLGILAVLLVLLTVYAPKMQQGASRSPTRQPSCSEQWGGHSGGTVFPAALVVVAVGLVITVVYHPEVLSALRLGPSIPVIRLPTWAQFRRGVVLAGLPQLPLTALNSLVAVQAWVDEEFPDKPLDLSRLSILQGAFNLATCMGGSLPCCNGVGGLAAQTAFGARTGAAPMALGAAKVVLGLLFGSSLLKLFMAFPGTLLGALLIFSGLELAVACRAAFHGPRWDTLLMLATAALVAASKNAFVGVTGGLVVEGVVRVSAQLVQIDFRVRRETTQDHLLAA